MRNGSVSFLIRFGADRVGFVDRVALLMGFEVSNKNEKPKTKWKRHLYGLGADYRLLTEGNAPRRHFITSLLSIATVCVCVCVCVFAGVWVCQVPAVQPCKRQ